MTKSATSQTSTEIKGYWIPGCSSCLRMKEFLQKSGREFEAINLEEHPEEGERLQKLGLAAPAVVVGDQAVPGLDLAGIAKLIGVAYECPEILAPSTLKRRYAIVTRTMSVLVAQLSVSELQYRSPDRDRTLAELACHIGSIIRAFVDAYDREYYDQSLEKPVDLLSTPRDIVSFAEQSQDMFDEWWDRFGFDDPLDRVIRTYWGSRTLHEVLERSVWHPMQHTRQLTMFVERLGMVPARRLSADELAGLPLPEGVHAGDLSG